MANVLTEKQRREVAALYVKGLSVAEIAVCTGLHRQAVKDSLKWQGFVL